MKKTEMRYKLLDFILKVGDDINIKKIDNGFIFEANGRDADDNWKTVRLACKDRSELDDLLNEFEAADRAD